MEKFMMFNEIPDTTMVMYQDGTIKSVDEVKVDYPILGTALGVIGFTTDDKGTVGDLIVMGYYDNINRVVDIYKMQGAEINADMTDAEKCEAITEFINNPVSEADEALDAFLNM